MGLVAVPVSEHAVYGWSSNALANTWLPHLAIRRCPLTTFPSTQWRSSFFPRNNESFAGMRGNFFLLMMYCPLNGVIPDHQWPIPTRHYLNRCVCVCAHASVLVRCVCSEDWQMSIRRYIFRRRTRSCRPKYPVVQLLETSGRLLAQSKHDFIEKAEPALREGSRRATALGPAPEGAPRKESVVRYTAYTYG